MVMLYVGKEVALAATGWKPELIPTVGVVTREQGSANVDCVREWFFAWNSKLIVSPALTVTLDGTKASSLLAPTVTVTLAAEARTAEAKRVAAVENRILVESTSGNYKFEKSLRVYGC